MDSETEIHYHGTTSAHVFAQFRTPTEMEIMDVTQGGVIYTTTDPEKAIKYATEHGQIVVCSVNPRKAIPYARQRAEQNLPPKKGKYTRDVFVSLPQDVTPEIFFNPTTFQAIMNNQTAK